MTGAPEPTSIAARLTLLLGLVALSVFSAVGTLLHWSLERELLRAERLELQGKADVVQHYIDELQQPGDLAELRHRLDDALIGSGALRVWIIGADGRVLYGGARAPATRAADGGGLSITRDFRKRRLARVSSGLGKSPTSRTCGLARAASGSGVGAAASNAFV